jgi:DNA polymerase III subunit delta
VTPAEILADIDAKKPKPVYLLTGEEYLVRRTSDEIVSRLVPKSQAALNVSILEGASPVEVARDLTTLPMFRGSKVVLVREPEFIAPKKGRQHALASVREAWNEGRRDSAAKRALALASRAGWGAGQLDPSAEGAPTPEDWKRELDVELADADVAFLKEVARYCKDRGLAVPEGATRSLEEVLEKGLPPGHHLVIEAQAVDRKSALYKLFENIGAVIDRAVEHDLKRLSITETVSEALRPLGKRLTPRAEERLKDLCGGSMRLVHSELEKLSAYVGDRATIEESDVEELVLRSREDDFFELSNALFARDAAGVIQYFERALAQGDVPLRLHAAFATSVRRLLEERERCDRRQLPSGRMSYRDFQDSEFRAIAEAAKAAGRKPPHPFAAYNAMQAAQRFTLRELLEAHAHVADADLALKSSADSALVLASLAWQVCGFR